MINPNGIDPREVGEGDPIWVRISDPIWVRISDEDAATILDDRWISYHSGFAHWDTDTLYVRTDRGARITVSENAEIIGWTPQLDFGDGA